MMRKSATKVLQDGKWRVIHQYATYRILHHCRQGVYSWDAGTEMHGWVAVSQHFQQCIGCGASPPEDMEGFVNLLKWEM